MKKILAMAAAALISCNLFQLNFNRELAHAEEELTPAISENRNTNYLGQYYDGGGLPYDTLGDSINSYLFENDDGTFTRFENISESIIVESCSNNYRLLSSNTIEHELTWFDGFYCGESYNYVIFANNNSECDDNCEVMRIVKFSKDWERIDSCSLYGLNTHTPGINAHLTEQNGYLYVHTCHKMYNRHQANMTLVINTETMQCTQNSYSVSNISTGYVSHSFDQYVQVENNDLYRVDLGDGAPRGIAFTKSSVDNIKDCGYANLPIWGEYGDNDTGVSLGGFELAEENLIVVGNAVDLFDSEDYNAFEQRNIFICTTSKNLETSELYYLTNYDDSADVYISYPKLVKIDNDNFLIMWSENWAILKYATLNGYGELTSEIQETTAALSDCQPLVKDDGNVLWYVTHNSEPCFYELNINDLSVSSHWSVEISESGSCGDDVSYTLDSNGVLTISGNGAVTSNFKGNPYINEVIVEEGVTGIGSFEKCMNLKSITLPSSVTKIVYGAFKYCIGLTDMVIPNGITIIESDAFRNCSNLKNVTISDSSTELKIAGFSFGDCYSLNSINIPSRVTSIDSQTFFYCRQLQSIDVSQESTEYSSIDGVLFNKEQSELVYYPLGKTSETYTVPGGIKSIGYAAFQGCKQLKMVSMASGVETIAGKAFNDCANLSDINIPDSVTNTESSAFDGTAWLELKRKENPLVIVGNGVLIDGTTCSGDITIPDNVTFIGGKAFYSCRDITSIVIPDSVTSINFATFMGCSKLSSITIPESITLISSQAFDNCTSLTSITIPASATEIHASAFDGCSGLTDVYYLGSEEDWNNIETSYVDKTKTLTDAFSETTTIHFMDTATISLPGDANGDNAITILDVIALNKNLLAGGELSEQGKLNADVDGDGKPSVTDSMLILKYVIKLIDSFTTA